LKGGFGGHEGRALRKGDRLALLKDGTSELPAHIVYGVEPPHIAMPRLSGVKGTVAVRVLPAGEYEKFRKSGQALFWNSNWKITSNSNRQGYRLAGPACPTEGQ